MRSMFEGADKINQPLNAWDVSAVVNFGDMLYMYNGAHAQSQLPSWYYSG